MGRTRITLLSQLVVAEADWPRVLALTLTLALVSALSLSLPLACSSTMSPLAKKRGEKNWGCLVKKSVGDSPSLLQLFHPS
jgi:hypothetical protein